MILEEDQCFKERKFLKIARRLTEFKEVKYVATFTGDYMIMMEIWTKNTAVLPKYFA